MTGDEGLGDEVESHGGHRKRRGNSARPCSSLQGWLCDVIYTSCILQQQFSYKAERDCGASPCVTLLFFPFPLPRSSEVKISTRLLASKGAQKSARCCSTSVQHYREKQVLCPGTARPAAPTWFDSKVDRTHRRRSNCFRGVIFPIKGVCQVLVFVLNF